MTDLDSICTITGIGLAVGTVTYIFGSMFDVWQDIRLYVDRKILKKDSQVHFNSVVYAPFSGVYVKGKKKDKVDNARFIFD